jgi:hypothetical protein
MYVSMHTFNGAVISLWKWQSNVETCRVQYTLIAIIKFAPAWNPVSRTDKYLFVGRARLVGHKLKPLATNVVIQYAAVFITDSDIMLNTAELELTHCSHHCNPYVSGFLLQIYRTSSSASELCSADYNTPIGIDSVRTGRITHRLVCQK